MGSRIQRMLHHVRGPAVLHVGCIGQDSLNTESPSWLHGHLVREFPQTLGIDIDGQQIEVMRERGFSNCRVMDAECMDFDRRFDTIVAGELIEHLANPGRFLERASHFLEDRGRLVLSTPYAFGLFYSLYAWLRFPRTCPTPQHTCWYCPQTLTTLIERSGLQVQCWELVTERQSLAATRGHSWPMKLYVMFNRVFGAILPGRITGTTLVFVAGRRGRPQA